MRLGANPRARHRVRRHTPPHVRSFFQGNRYLLRTLAETVRDTIVAGPDESARPLFGRRALRGRARGSGLAAVWRSKAIARARTTLRQSGALSKGASPRTAGRSRNICVTVRARPRRLPSSILPGPGCRVRRCRRSSATARGRSSMCHVMCSSGPATRVGSWTRGTRHGAGIRSLSKHAARRDARNVHPDYAR